MNTNKLTTFTRELVRRQGLSGAERDVTERIQAEMRALDFDVVRTDKNGTVIGIIEGRAAGPTLLLDAHCDTVGVAPGTSWKHDPFAAEVHDGIIYGRGTADMKGALAAMIYAAGSIDRARLSGRIVVTATVMEEVMEGYSLGTVIEEEIVPDFVVVGEATDFNLNRGGRGRAEIHLETIGVPAHSSSPEVGHNAVLDMLEVVHAIEQMDLPSHPLMGPAIMALTDIISDPYPGYSVIPSRCKVTYDRRLVPDETPEDVVGAITALPAAQGIDLNVTIAQGEHEAYTGEMIRGPKFFPAWIFDEAHPFVQDAYRGLRSAGLSPDIGAYRFCTNGAYSAGRAGIPTVGFGPAAESDAHVVDEHLAIEDLVRAAQGYLGIVEAVLELQ